MTRFAISAENLGKKYIIGHKTEEKYSTLRDLAVRQSKNAVRSALDLMRGRPLIVGDEHEEFWALQNINFNVEHGEVVGIIGKNGAGKSTLLKVLSQITEPSSGRVVLNGRVASLLEVGTGFHPELSGRENIYLNGAILGMSRGEIRKKFDEIVQFAGVEKFLDTPVKRYSSGMYVRLAFSVAAHLEPEILIVDEVLAVGDAEFQRKCLGKMKDVSTEGRTVLFVSHNMGSIRTLCEKGILLERGGTSGIQSVTQALSAYGRSMQDAEEYPESKQVSLRPTVTFDDQGGFQSPTIQFDVKVVGPVKEPHIGIALFDEYSNRVTTISSDSLCKLPDIEKGETLEVRFKASDVLITPQRLRVKLALSTSDQNIEVYESYTSIDIENYYPFSLHTIAMPSGTVFTRPQVTFRVVEDACA